MKKLNDLSLVVYLIYLAYNLINLLIVLGARHLIYNFTFKFFLINLTGSIAVSLFMLYFIAYNIFLFQFVYRYCAKNQLPGFLWLVIVIFMPSYLGLIGFIAFRYKEHAYKFYQYLTVPNFDINKIQCSKCGQYILENSNNCPYCGNEHYNVCKKCGHKINKKYAYCDQCGTETSK